MNLTSATFSELHQRVTRAACAADLAKAELNGKTLEKLLKLMETREQLWNLQSVDHQKAAYGESRWGQELVQLSTVHQDRNSRLEGEPLRQQIWQALPNSPFKRFQELFSHPQQFVVPHYEIDNGGRVIFRSDDVRKLSLRGSLVAGDLIPEKLAEDLGLADFSDDFRRPLRRLEKKCSPEAIEMLKLIFEAAVPLRPGNYRVLVISPAAPAVAERYPGREIPKQLHGSILYSREDGSAGAVPGRLVVGHFQSAYGAQRKTFHEAIQYMAEIRTLADIKTDLRQLNARLNESWRKDAPAEVKASLLAEAERLSARCVSTLELCANKYKIKARDLIAGIEQLRDSTGRINISGSMMKMTAAVTALEKRFYDMMKKNSFNQDDQMMLQDALARQERIMQRFASSVNTAAQVMKGRLRLFNDDRLTPAQIAVDSSGILRRAGFDGSGLGGVTMRPSRSYAEGLQLQLGEFKQALAAPNRDAALRALAKMELIGKCHEVELGCERMRQLLVYRETVPKTAIQAEVDKLGAVLNSPSGVSAHSAVDSCRPTMNALRRTVAALTDALAQEDDPEGGEVWRMTLRERLEECEIEGLVRRI